MLIPFLHGISDLKLPISFHTPNAMNARFIDMELAQLMVRSGFASFFLGLESSDMAWQQSTGGKVGSDEFAAAVGYLKESGTGSITAYIIIGHPDSEGQAVESTIDFANRCGARVLLSEFSPVPGTVDGVKCSPWADLSEPLSHNKTAFAIRRLGLDKVNQLKQFAHLKNAALTSKPQGFEVNPARLKW